MSKSTPKLPVRGFSESQTPFDAAPTALAGRGQDQGQPLGRMTLGSGGRLLIPSDVRAALGIREGDTLLATLVEGELRLTPLATAVQRAQAFVRATTSVHTEGVVEEFLREKRYEQMLEDLKG
jgi:AbrB family looped-hinge helix DNA binding protein